MVILATWMGQAALGRFVMTEMSISQTVLAKGIERRVSEVLSSLCRELNEFTTDMNVEDAKTAKFMILGMVNDAAEAFYNKMRERIERNERLGIENGKRVNR